MKIPREQYCPRQINQSQEKKSQHLDDYQSHREHLDWGASDFFVTVLVRQTTVSQLLLRNTS